MGVLYRELEQHVGYRFGDDGSIWSRWKRAVGPGWVLSDEWRMIKPSLDKNGYPRITINRRAYFFHLLILEAFRGPCPAGLEGCHNDGVPSNCRLGNLRYDTCKANLADRVRHGTMPVGARNGRFVHGRYCKAPQ